MSTRTKKNRLLVALLICLPILGGFKAPQHDGYVTDHSGILSSRTEQQLEAYSAALDRQTGIQIATLIVPTTGEDWTLEDYAYKVYEAWGIGKKGDDAGALLLVAVQDRQIRIEVGYGLEGILNDARVGAFIDTEILPQFKAGDIQKGVFIGHAGLVQTIASAYNITLSQRSTQRPSHQNREYRELKLSELTLSEIIVGVALIIAIIIGMIISPTFREIMFWILLSFLSGDRRRSSSGHFGGSGFGGFGGGLSGGGGASRSW